MFQTTVQDGLARCGVVICKQGPIVTPTPMLYTRRGSSVFLTPDMLEKLRPQGAQLVQVNALQFLSLPGPGVLQAVRRSLQSYMGLPGWPLFASNRDPTLTEYVGTRQAKDAAAYVNLHTGALSVSPERYMEAIAAMGPDVFVALADEVPADATAKRAAAAVDRTTKWLDRCLQLHQQQLAQQQAGHDGGSAANGDAAASSSSSSSSSLLFAPVVGAGSEAQRARSAQAAAERDVAGFALCGLGMGERPAERPALMAAALQHLPPDKPRAAVGLDCPEDVLSAVQAGVDLLDCSYPLQATADGYALCFPLTPAAGPQQQPGRGQQQQQQSAAAPSDAVAANGQQQDSSWHQRHDHTAHSKQPQQRQQHQHQPPPQQQQLLVQGVPAAGAVDAALGFDGTKLNLWAVTYRLDKRPLVPGCSCFACTHHSRAYIHHLLQTHEILGGVLLETHNTHWWLAWFGALRAAIQQGRLAEYAAWFTATRQRQQQQQQETSTAA